MCKRPPFDLCFFRKNVCIDRAIVAPGYGKDLVNGLNACDKQHLKRYMKLIHHTHEGYYERNIKPYLVYEKYYSRLLMNLEDIV